MTLMTVLHVLNFDSVVMDANNCHDMILDLDCMSCPNCASLQQVKCVNITVSVYLQHYVQPWLNRLR